MPDTPLPTVLTFFEVHHWPHTGNLLLIHKQAHHDRPALTWLQVSAVDGLQIGDATVALAHALGAAAGLEGPEALVVLHDRHGNMLATAGGLGLNPTALRRVTPR